MRNKKTMKCNSETNKSNISNEISQNSFDQLVEFYNENEKSFLKIESKFGVNLWFLNHFRTYFSYRNLLLNEEGKLSNGSVYQIELGLTKIRILFRIVYELLLMLIRYRHPKINKTEYVIISNSPDIVNNRNKRFGNLDYDILHNRSLLDIKKKASLKEFAPRKTTNTDNIFLYYVFRCSFILDLLKFKSHLNQLLKEISRENTSIQKSKYRYILRFLKKNRFFFYIIYLRFKSLDLYFKKSNINGILLSDENSPQQKVIQYAAFRNNIKVFGFQHGNIHSLHPAYIYGKYKTKPLLPTITFTWGSYFTDLLKNQGGYPANAVKTVGRILPPNNSRTLNPLINEKDNIVLYASQPQRNPEIRYKLLADILCTIKELNSLYKLVIRPHPNEKDNIFFNTVAKDVGFHNFIIDRESDLSTHFEVCSIVLVAFSTVGTEFIPYFKPLLVLDYLDQDLIKWIERGVGIPIRNKNELLTQLSSDELKIDSSKYKKFLKNYYTVDSNVLDKIKNTIHNLQYNE